MLTFLEYLEWRGQRGEQKKGIDIRKTGGRPKGTWVGGNPRYGKSGNAGNKPHLSREADKEKTKKEIEEES
jgi:hypothetical protein